MPYRRKLEMDNRDKVVVFIGEHFAILKNWEMLLLLGVPVRERTVMGESAETVLRRYGAELPEPGS